MFVRHPQHITPYGDKLSDPQLSHAHRRDQSGRSLVFTLASLFHKHRQSREEKRSLAVPHHMRARARQATQISPSCVVFYAGVENTPTKRLVSRESMNGDWEIVD